MVCRLVEATFDCTLQSEFAFSGGHFADMDQEPQEKEAGVGS